MAKRNIVWTETAAKQRRGILKYWVKRNGTTTYAEKLIKITADHLKIIKEDPSAFKEADFPDTRISVFGHFSILYKFTSESIIVTAFWDNRQDSKKLLEQLKK
ncbi:MAG: type II toxin-antitoxin system RelE/ParE family toxin [Bacteroidota bacterium]|jgi:plasmid stabilization system protein ParE